MEIREYKRALLVPLSIAFAVFLLLLVVTAYLLLARSDTEKSRRNVRMVEQALKLAVEQDRDKLAAVLRVLENNARLKEAFRSGRRELLLASAEPLFARLRSDHGITHWYFMTPERRIFLRVHQPARHGDVVARGTALAAELAGELAAGTELGPLGIFTLRVVVPWRDGDALLGYMEVGMETDRTLSMLSDLVDVSTFMLIDKAVLDRAGWESGMRMLGRTPDWDRYPRVVLVGKTRGGQPDALPRHPGLLAGAPLGEGETRIVSEGRILYFSHVPLLDVGQRRVGTMVIERDGTEDWTDHFRYLVVLFLAAILLWVLVMFSAGRLIDRVHLRVFRTERERDVFRDQSERDGLTGLFNQARFYRYLEEELQRATANRLECAVLMLDIDHFKETNDRYGHRAGDAALSGIAETLRENLRPDTIAARYGGEEFAVILPDADAAKAYATAERLRKAIAARRFGADRETLALTVSIGVAVFPASGATPQAMVSEADRALYAAKEQGRDRTSGAGAPEGI